MKYFIYLISLITDSMDMRIEEKWPIFHFFSAFTQKNSPGNDPRAVEIDF